MGPTVLICTYNKFRSKYINFCQFTSLIHIGGNGGIAPFIHIGTAMEIIGRRQLHFTAILVSGEESLLRTD